MKLNYTNKAIVFILFLSSFLLSSCSLLYSNVRDEPQPQIHFSCSGSTTVVLRDYCYNENFESGQLKLLIANRNVNDITNIELEISGTTGHHEISERVSIEIDEVFLLEVDVPRSLGNLIDLSITPVFLSGRGLESCRTEGILFEDIRLCEN